MPPPSEKVKLECWVWAQSASTNDASTSVVKDWSTADVHRVINAHVKSKGGAQVTKDSPHTLLSISAPCIAHFLFMLSNALTYGLVFLGMNGCGKTSVAVTMLLALSRMYSGKVNGQIFQISDLDQLRGKKAGGDTPVFFDDGFLRAASVVFLKHFFGIPNIPMEQLLMVRFEHASLTHDCPRAAADNPVDQEKAQTIRPEDMTVKTLLDIIRPCFDTKIDHEDLAAVHRRCAYAVFRKCPEEGIFKS